jgi:hypothetical protein
MKRRAADLLSRVGFTEIDANRARYLVRVMEATVHTYREYPPMAREVASLRARIDALVLANAERALQAAVAVAARLPFSGVVEGGR